MNEADELLKIERTLLAVSSTARRWWLGGVVVGAAACHRRLGPAEGTPDP